MQMIQCNKVQCVTTLSINYYRATEMQSSIMFIILFRCKDVEMTTPSKITQKIILFSPKYTFLKTLFKYDIYRSNINDFSGSQGSIKTNQKMFC